MNALTRLAAALAAVLTVLLLQAGLIDPLVFPVPVSLPALMIISAAVYAGPGIGLGLGFATGLLADLGSDHPAGVLALSWLVAGIVAGKVGGLATERGYGTRPVALLAAVIATGAALLSGLMLAILGSHAATVAVVLRDEVPTFLGSALLGLLVVPVVRRLVRSQGLRAARPRAELVGRADG